MNAEISVQETLKLVLIVVGDTQPVTMLKMVRKCSAFLVVTTRMILNFAMLHVSATIGSGSCTGDKIKGPEGNYGYSCGYLQGKRLDSII